MKRGSWRVGQGALLAIMAFGTAMPALAQQVDVGAPPPPADELNKPKPDATQADAGSGPRADTQRRARSHMLHPRDPSPSSLAGDTQSAPPPGLIGDWQDIRTRMGERGIGLSARYASETAYNFTGGDRNLVAETGQFDFGALLDLGKLVGWSGAALQGTVTWRRGIDLTTTAGLGALQQVQEVYGRGQTVRLTQLWLQQKLGSKVEVKLGRTNPGEDFAVFSCHFQNLSFCGAQPGNLAGDYWYNWPVSQWGANVHVDVAPGVYVQGGAYEVNPRNLESTFFIGHFKGATGVLLPAEIGWTRGGDKGGVGSYKLGGWISTADGDDLVLDVNRQPRAVTGLAPLQHSSRYGVFASVQQQLTGTSKDGRSLTGFSMFANVTFADRATSLTDNQVSVGLFYKGLAPSLPGDVIGLAVARTNVNGRIDTADRLAGKPARDAEYAAELYYSVSPTEWLVVQPNVQWIHQPGGVKNAKDVGVLGLKFALTL